MVIKKKYGFLARTLKRFFSYILEIHIQLLFSTNKQKKKKILNLHYILSNYLTNKKKVSVKKVLSIW